MANPFTDALQHDVPPGLHEGALDRRNYAVVNEDGKPPFRRYPYTFHADSFLVFQPWTACPVCVKAVEQDAASAPPPACPHVRKAEYVALRNKMLREGYQETSHHRAVLDSGAVIVSIEWVEPIPGEAQKTSPGRL